MCFIFLLCTLMTSANKSIEEKNWKCYKTIGSYVSCVFIEIWSTWEVWRALKKLELLSAMPRATLTHLSCSPNFPCASYLDERMLTYEQIVKYTIKRWMHWRHILFHLNSQNPLLFNLDIVVETNEKITFFCYTISLVCYILKQIFTLVLVASGGYLPCHFARQYISTTTHFHFKVCYLACEKVDIFFYF